MSAPRVERPSSSAGSHALCSSPKSPPGNEAQSSRSTAKWPRVVGNTSRVAECAALGVRCRSRALPCVPHRSGIAERTEGTQILTHWGNWSAIAVARTDRQRLQRSPVHRTGLSCRGIDRRTCGPHQKPLRRLSRLTSASTAARSAVICMPLLRRS
jgi:hypothetical protein